MSIFALVMISENQIDETVRQLFGGISFTEEPAGLYDPLRYMISIGGKRIRPRLCLTSYALFKDVIGEDVLEPAVALEVFHTFTLIHDDIMDKSALRRGKPTVWTRWNEDTAILSGDVMLIDAYKRIAKAPAQVLDKALALFSKTAAEVCEGQQYDMDFEDLQEVPMASYEKMIGLKTGVLLACSAGMGALIAGASDEECKALYDYGFKLGMAFQIADDWLDAYGDEKVFGKPIGGDIVNSKKSWLTVRAMEKTCDKEGFVDAMGMPAGTQTEKTAKIAAVKAIYDSLGVADDAKSEIVRWSGEAIEAVRGIGLSPVRMESLRRFAEKLIGRVS